MILTNTLTPFSFAAKWFIAGAMGLTVALVVGLDPRLRARFGVWEFLDVAATAVSFGFAAACLAMWVVIPEAPRVFVWGLLLCSAVGTYLWNLGSQARRKPKARGEGACTFLILLGLGLFLMNYFGPRYFWTAAAEVGGAVYAIAGTGMLWWVKRRFRAQKKEHLLVEQIAVRGDVLQTEYHRATPECPYPERWHMYDSLSAEVEVLDFLKALVIALKPELVVETGTFSGLSALRIAEGLAANGFGRVITCEVDKKVYDAAVARFAASGLACWIDARNESSLEMNVDGRIDLLFCDSEGPLREQEVRRFLPQVNSNGLILIHDASSSLKIVREAALRLEAEGLLSVLLLPTPRGLVMAQKRAGRS